MRANQYCSYNDYKHNFGSAKSFLPRLLTEQSLQHQLRQHQKTDGAIRSVLVATEAASSASVAALQHQKLHKLYLITADGDSTYRPSAFDLKAIFPE